MSASNQTSSLPQGFSVYQPALGAQLQFFPALGSQELDELINAYIVGPASIKDKRASISVDFLEYTQMTGQTFKFYPVYSVPSISSTSTSPMQDSASSFNASPVASSWDWSQVSGNASSSRSSVKSHRVSKSTSPAVRQRTTDFSHIPGMKIMTKEGLDVTNAASRGSKTKEQRDHAHLMRIIKACDSCRRKKIRCDPSHKKRAASQAQSKPAARQSKMQPAAVQEPIRPAPSLLEDEISFAAPFEFDSLVNFDEPDAMELSSVPVNDWEEFVQYPSMELNISENYDFFADPDGYLSSQTSSSASPTKSFTPPSLQESVGVLGSDAVLDADSLLAYQDSAGSLNDYVDFNLFSPGSSFSEDDRMISIETPPVRRTQSPSAPGSDTFAPNGQMVSTGGDGVISWYDAGVPGGSPLTTNAAFDPQGGVQRPDVDASGRQPTVVDDVPAAQVDASTEVTIRVSGGSVSVASGDIHNDDHVHSASPSNDSLSASASIQVVSDILPDADQHIDTTTALQYGAQSPVIVSEAVPGPLMTAPNPTVVSQQESPGALEYSPRDIQHGHLEQSIDAASRRSTSDAQRLPTPASSAVQANVTSSGELSTITTTTATTNATGDSSLLVSTADELIDVVSSVQSLARHRGTIAHNGDQQQGGDVEANAESEVQADVQATVQSGVRATVPADVQTADQFDIPASSSASVSVANGQATSEHGAAVTPTALQIGATAVAAYATMCLVGASVVQQVCMSMLAARLAAQLYSKSPSSPERSLSESGLNPANVFRVDAMGNLVGGMA